MLCTYAGKNSKSVCEEEDDDKVSRIIQQAFLDPPSKKKYNFRKNPPKLVGQIGVPIIVDTILGNICSL